MKTRERWPFGPLAGMPRRFKLAGFSETRTESGVLCQHTTHPHTHTHTLLVCATHTTQGPTYASNTRRPPLPQLSPRPAQAPPRSACTRPARAGRRLTFSRPLAADDTQHERKTRCVLRGHACTRGSFWVTCVRARRGASGMCEPIHPSPHPLQMRTRTTSSTTPPLLTSPSLLAAPATRRWPRALGSRWCPRARRRTARALRLRAARRARPAAACWSPRWWCRPWRAAHCR